MFELDAPFWALVALILFLALVLYLKVPRLIADMLDKRSAAIREDLDRAAQLRKDAEELLVEYQRKAKDAEKEAAAIIDQARREADALGAEAEARANEYVERRQRLAEQKIAE